MKLENNNISPKVPWRPEIFACLAEEIDTNRRIGGDNRKHGCANRSQAIDCARLRCPRTPNRGIAGLPKVILPAADRGAPKGLLRAESQESVAAEGIVLEMAGKHDIFGEWPKNSCRVGGHTKATKIEDPW